MEHLSVTKFREYIKIKSVHPDPDYDGAVTFLKQYAKELQLKCQTVKVGKDQLEVVLLSLEGTDPALKSIVLNSHTDVVPVYPEHWKYDAFAAHKDENGNIYGRGTQDMKCVGIQYLETIRKLVLERKLKFRRTIYLLFVPDEEVGGVKGMKSFMQTELFKTLNIGFVLDEGLANPNNKYSVFYGERTPWWLEIRCEGPPGHGSRFINDNAPEKLVS